MKPLNEALYDALCDEFGSVIVADEGVELTAAYRKDCDGLTRMQLICPGEYYRICCAYCGDTRYRLWINHRWGVRDPVTGTRNRWLAHCYNESCMQDDANRRDLIERTSWYHREAGADRVTVREGTAAEPDRAIPLPDDYQLLDQLDRGHPARRYVRSRGFHPDALARKWHVGFSLIACRWSREGRLLIPVYRVVGEKPVCWGWQARAIVAGEEPKYYTAKGVKKSHSLYGLDRVQAGDRPVLLCEGPTDVWRADRNAVALLGKHASTEQVKLILRHLHGRPLVIALDGEARHEAERLVDAIRTARARSILNPDAAPVVPLRLPVGRDPCDCEREELWVLARHALTGKAAPRVEPSYGTDKGNEEPW